MKLFSKLNQGMSHIVKTCIACHLLAPNSSLDRNFDRDNPFATQLRFFLLLPNPFVHLPSIHSSFKSLALIQDGFTFVPALESLLPNLDALFLVLASPLARLITSNHCTKLPYWLQGMNNIAEIRIGSTLIPFNSGLDVNFDLENQSATRCLRTLNSRLLQVCVSFDSNLNTRLMRFDVPSDSILSALNLMLTKYYLTQYEKH